MRQCNFCGAFDRIFCGVGSESCFSTDCKSARSGNSRKGEAFVMIVCKNAVTGIAEVYALKINDINKLQMMIEIELENTMVYQMN